MNLIKSSKFINPVIDETIHIIGCGAVGSLLAWQLVKTGFTNFVIWDDDVVEDKNLVNQFFDSRVIGVPKVTALKALLKETNPEVKITAYNKKFENQIALDGFVFLAVDSIETRKSIAEFCVGNNNIVAMFDFRIGLDVVQHYAADWSSEKSVKNFINTMQFTHEEVVEENQDGVCQLEESILSSVLIVTSHGVVNFCKYLRKEPIKDWVHSDVLNFGIGSL